MINPLSLRPDLAEALRTADSKTDEGLLLTILTAFMPGNTFNVEAQLAFIMTMTLAVMPTIECYRAANNSDCPSTENIDSYLKKLKHCWLNNEFTDTEKLRDPLVKPRGTKYQALDESFLVLHSCYQILRGLGHFFSIYKNIIELVTEGYAILPAVHPEETEMLRSWLFDEVIPYCAASALPPFIYTINGIEPTAAALRQLLNHE